MERERVVERLVAWIWDRQALLGPLPGDDGRQYQVVFRGRPWGERGPDFQGAILARDDGQLLRGDVEVHVRGSDWRRHGHWRDPAYDGTVCHVVLWNDQNRPTPRADGVAIPTVELVNRLAGSLAELEARRLADSGRSRDEPACIGPADGLGELLDRAGLLRFFAKSAAFEGDLSCLPAAEVLYRGALRAMGYTANTHGFERLAATLPLDELRRLAGGASDRVEALLLGVAGMLPSQRQLPVEGEWPARLDGAWAKLSGRAPRPLSPRVWRTRRVRPENRPVRRVAGASRVLAGWLSHDPLELLLDDLAETERLGRPLRLAEPWRVRTTEPFWVTHFDFGRESPGARPWLIGMPRASEVAVNVLLPFLHALGEHLDDSELSERALNLYRRFPAVASNRVTSEMARQLGVERGHTFARTACRQQGLIHLYRRWCDAHDCERCPAGKGGGIQESGVRSQEPGVRSREPGDQIVSGS